MKIMQLLRTCLSGVYVASSTVLEQAYLSANAVQKQELLAEFYSPEFRLFKGMITAGKGRSVSLYQCPWDLIIITTWRLGWSCF
jgi:hypothetical protein